MTPAKSKFQVLTALAVMLFFGLSVGCNGFFVDPVLTTITVGPTSQTLNVGTTLQMSARGTFNDGSVANLGSGLSWSSSDPTVASITSGGLVTGVAAGGPVTITAEKDTVSGTAQISVALNNVTSITISPTTATVQLGGTQSYTAKATVAGQAQPVDVSATVTWTLPQVTDSSISISSGQSPAILTVSSSAAPGTYQLVATYSNGVSGNATFVVP